MTGTGTKDEPYIVNSWEEYTSITSNTAYVEFDPNAENKVIDFNEIQPEGFSSAVKFKDYTNFNGWTLRNFHSTASTVITTGNALNCSNLIFENFYWCPSAKNAVLLDSNGSVTRQLTNCIISGEIQSTYSIKRIVPNLYESSMNIVANIADSLQVAANIVNSEIIFDISATSVKICETLDSSPGKVLNSRISGKIQSSENVSAGTPESAYNVFNIQSNQPLDYQGKGISVYNSDITTATQSGNFIGCTAEQLRNAQYLYDLRFPIGVD